jgi:hypothetical protein
MEVQQLELYSMTGPSPELDLRRRRVLTVLSLTRLCRHPILPR